MYKIAFILFIMSILLKISLLPAHDQLCDRLKLHV